MPTPRPTRWLLRITMALAMAFVAWWAVHELVRPQPCLRFTMPAGVIIDQAQGLGSWFVIQAGDQRRMRQGGDRLWIFDFARQRFINQPELFKQTDPERWFDKEQTRANSTSIIVKEKSRTIKIYDTTNGTLTKEVFPERSRLHLSEDGSTLLESTTLPLAPFAALSPAPLSGLSASLLMSCDAQRMAPYEIGFQLVQVRLIPSFDITSRYALPPHAEIYHLQLSADGKYLVHGFGQSITDYLTMPVENYQMNNDVPPVITRPIPRDIPDNLRLLKTLRWMFPESIDILRAWTRITMNHDRYGRLANELWVNIDLTGVWPDLGSGLEIYDAHTGKRLHSRQMMKNGKAIQYRCMKVEQDWAFISYVEPFDKEKQVEREQAVNRTTITLHLPTGRVTEVLSFFLNDKGYIKLAPGTKPGTSIGMEIAFNYRSLPGNKINEVDLTSALHRFNADGTIEPIYQSPEIGGALVIPHGNQLAIARTWKYQLPEWVMEYVLKYPWLTNLLRADRMDIVDGESHTTLWSFDRLDRSERDSVPGLFLSDDRKFIVVPVQLEAPAAQNFGHYRYDVYRLPLSSWLYRWPWLAAGVVLGLFISQGFRRCRVGSWFRGTWRAG